MGRPHDWRGQTVYIGMGNYSLFVCASCRITFPRPFGRWDTPCHGTRDTHPERYRESNRATLTPTPEATQ